MHPVGWPWCLSRLSLSSVVSAALSSRATQGNPQRVTEGNPLNPQSLTLSEPTLRHYPCQHIFLDTACFIYGTLDPILEDICRSILTQRSRLNTENMFLVFHCESQWKSCDRFVIFCRKMINARHSFDICQPRKNPTPHLLKRLNERLPASRSFIPTFGSLPPPAHISKAYINVGQQRMPQWWPMQTESLCDPMSDLLPIQCLSYKPSLYRA